MKITLFAQSVVILALCAWSRAESAAGKMVPDFATLARQAMTTLPAPPPWDLKQAAVAWTIDDLTTELSKYTSNLPRINSVRTNLLRPEHAWFTDLSDWFRRIQKPLKLRYVDELWDCDNYANCYVAFADLIALKAGEARGSLCIGRATIHYRVAYGGIPARSGHALVIAGTSKGFFLLDPQNGTLVSLAKFPNRDSIDEISF